ncbi:MAG: hypothetical protein JW765_06365 [Deltaproteobacteria bacterium]|nr:hypothetical protein [Candidatus Zymogenaceae bacterium]
MKKIRITGGISRVFLFCVLMLLLPVLTYAVRIEDKDTGTDLLLMGLGVLRVNYTSVDGNPIIFEDSDRGLPAYFSNSSKVDFLVDGTVYHNYQVEGYVHYRDITYNLEPNLSVYFKIKKDLNYLSIGDHQEGVFTDTLFTRFEPEFRGTMLHIEDKNYGLELFGGAVRGSQVEDEIDADGSSGPYYTSYSPVMAATESVVIRVRDKNNPSLILKNNKQQRGIDYTIDYDTGKIRFTYPVDSTDFSGNPIFIVVTYQYDDPDGAYSRYVAGGRVWFLPHEFVRMGLTYLTNGPVNDTIGGSWDDRIQIYGTDLTIDNKDTFYLGAEFAAGTTPSVSDTTNFAYRGNFIWKPRADFRLWGGYYRVDKDFPTFGTTSFDIEKIVKDIRYEVPFDFKSGTDIYDLNPDLDVGLGTDEESWGLAGEYIIAPNHTLSAGYREIRDNIPYNDGLPRTTTRDVYVSYRYNPVDRFNYFVGTQWIRSLDDLAPKTADTETYRLIMGMKGPLGRSRITGPAKFEAAYVLDEFRDYVDDDQSQMTHYLLARLDIMPVDNLTFFFEQDEILVAGRGEDGIALWGNATWVGVDYRRKRLRAEAVYKFLTEHDYALGREVTREHLTSAIVTYKPTDTVGVRLKVEVGFNTDASTLPETTSVDYIAEAEIVWDIRPDLVVSVSYSLDTSADKTGDIGDETLEDEAVVRIEYSPEPGDLSLYGEYRFEQSYLKTDPLAAEETRTNTFIIGGRYKFLPDWEVVSGFKYAGTTGALESHKMDSFVEVGYDVLDYLKLSLGYEHQELYDRDDPDTDYKADIGYLKMTGKF